MKRIWIAQAIIILMILWGFQRGNPYEYYMALRWVCCVSFLYLAIRTWNQSKRAWTAIFVVTAIIYNPIFRFYATRDTWAIFNVATIGLAAVSIFVLKSER